MILSALFHFSRQGRDGARIGSWRVDRGCVRAMLWLIGAGVAGWAQPGVAAPIPGPAGIFVIGNLEPVANETERYDLDYVSGLTLPMLWSDLESFDTNTQSPVYDFSRIDTKLEELRARGKFMTLQIFANKAPAWVLALPNIVTWTNPHPNQGGVQVVPWDAQALAAYAQMINSLANHVVAGTSWRVADHPALQTIDSPIVGLHSLRELSGTLVAHPAYVRATFIQAVVDSITPNRQAFSNKFGFLALFPMDDAEGDVASLVYARLMEEFNVPGKPSLGFFQETLSDVGPQSTREGPLSTELALGELLRAASAKTYVMFQALRPWRVDSPETASGTPITGLARAWSDYGSTYVELYGADVLEAANVEPLRRWARFWTAVDAVRNGRQLLTVEAVSGGGVAVRWEADSLVVYKLWKSEDLVSWTLQESPAPSGGEVILPQPTTKQFFRLEVMSP